ncbi:MAG TPA: DUF4190 domain-containing protein [Terriglobales bacterium]|nr:DUF4190 domain-containing protein [Terriglobales bacterium]
MAGQTLVVPPQAAAAAPQAAPAIVPPAVLPAPGSLPPTAGAMPQTSGKAVASMVMGLANAMFAFLFFPLAVLAVIFGHMARTEIRKSGGRLKGDGFAVTGLITGYGSLGLVVLIMAIAIVGAAGDSFGDLGGSGGGETQALGALRTYLVATVTYDAQFARGYPPSLAAMGPGDGSENGAGLLDASMTSGEKYGYRYTYTPLDLNADGIYEAFTLTADPAGFSSLSGRHFFVDESGIIRVETDHMATSDSPQLQ